MRKYTGISLLSLALLGLIACGSDKATPESSGDGDSGDGDTGDGDSGDGDTGDGDTGDGDTGDGDTGDGDTGDGDTGDGDTGDGDTGDGDTGDGDTGDGGTTDVFIDSIELGKGEEITKENMIDDLEDGNDVILDNDDRVGSWYTFHDEESGDDAEQTPGTAFKPTSGGAQDSKFAAGTKGKGFKSYAGMGFDFNNDGKAIKVYDASKFKGISFLAKGDIDLRVGISISATVGKDGGGTCAAAADKCYDTHGVDIKPGKDWVKYDIPFAKIKQTGWGEPAEFDAKTVMSVSFSVPENATFDFAIDDIGFY